MINRWSPFRDLNILQDRINRLFSEETGRSEIEKTTGRAWAPVVDILETDNDLVVRAEIPGVRREDIDIEVTSESLSIRGERKCSDCDKEKVLRIERPYGSFERSFSIGVPVQADKVKAAYHDGVLEVTIPKAEEVKPKKIEVQAD